MNNKLFECSLGIHEYTIPDKYFPEIKICKHCKRFGYSEEGEIKYWYEFDKEGNMIHFKNNTGFERRYEYDKNGCFVGFKDSRI